MKISGFFIFGSKLQGSTFHAPPVDLDTIPSSNKLTPDLRLMTGDYDQIQFPILYKQTEGKILRDFLDTGYPGLYLISDRLKNILQETKLTGWKTYPIILLDKKGQRVDGYHGFSILGRCGPIDYSKCEIVEKRVVPELESAPIEKFYIGLYVGLDKWDGSDFFLPEK